MTRRNQYLLAALAAVLVVVVGVALVGSRTPPGNVTSPTPAASASVASSAATATTTAPSASAAATPTAPAAGFPSDAFGFVYYPNNRAVVRSEASDAEISSFTPQGRSFTFYSQTVSPDGRSIAYWEPVRGGPVLKVRPVTGGAPRAVLTGPVEMSGNAFSWSSDSTGLVVAMDNDCQEFCQIPAVNELWTVDLVSGATERVATGSIWLPVTWDRTQKLIAAGTTGPGGYLVSYDVIDLRQKPYQVRSTTYRPTVLGRLKASSDARFVLLRFDQSGSSALAWWPLAEPEKRSAVPFDGVAADWRPGTSQIWWVGGLTPPGCRVAPCGGTDLVSFDVVTGTRTVAQRGTYGPYLSGFRSDGTAALTSAAGSGPGTNSADVTLVELATGKTAKIAVSGALGPAVRLR